MSIPALLPEGNRRGPQRPAKWLIGLSVALAAVLLYLTLQGLDWLAFLQTLKNGDYIFLLIAAPIASINYIIRALRWRIFFRAERGLSALSVFWANMVGYLGNAYLPARFGEILRSAYLGRQSGVGTSFVLATALTERVLDTLALVLIGAVSLASRKEANGLLLFAVRAMAVAAAIGLVGIFLLPSLENRLVQAVQKTRLPASCRHRAIKELQRFLMGLRALRSLRAAPLFAVLTGAIWLIDGISSMISVRTIGQTLNLGQALILLAALGLSSAIPSTPGYVGVYQFVAVSVLVPFGFARSEALAYILIAQILGYLVVTFWGLIGLWQLRGSRRLPPTGKVDSTHDDS